jgi:hypothetical protein
MKKGEAEEELVSFERHRECFRWKIGSCPAKIAMILNFNGFEH